MLHACNRKHQDSITKICGSRVIDILTFGFEMKLWSMVMAIVDTTMHATTRFKNGC
jgi:hypothetical protein